MTYILPPGLVEVPFEDGSDDGHWFTYQDHYLKSVGKILDTVYPLPSIDPFYFIRGRFVHSACCLIDTNSLDWTALDSRLEPYCRAYQTFLDMSHPVIELSEQIVVALDYSYGGRLDRVMRLPGRKRLLITDIKVGNGKEKRYLIQLAAYAVALMGEKAGEVDLALLNLGANSQPRLTVLEDPASRITEWRGILAKFKETA